MACLLHARSKHFRVLLISKGTFNESATLLHVYCGCDLYFLKLNIDILLWIIE